MQAREAYNLIIRVLDSQCWTYERDDERLVIRTGVSGEDLPINFALLVNERNEVVQFISSLPIHMPEDMRVDGAIAVAVANYGMVDGSFDYDMSDVLYGVCNNEEQLCDILLDYCYLYNGNKEILWTVCGETIIKRLAQTRQMYYPVLDDNGDFEVQGRKYSMVVYQQGGEEDEN